VHVVYILNQYFTLKRPPLCVKPHWSLVGDQTICQSFLSVSEMTCVGWDVKSHSLTC